ncbi:MAG: hypothetical protein E7222_13885 [Clostridiales bacterium]|nr:hypothetical protein [Clostridiales bacterium]
MFERIKLNALEDYFVPCSGRNKKGVFFCRLTRYSEEIHKIICRYLEATRKKGVCIQRKIDNPDEKQLSYYEEIMGRDFQLNPNYFMVSLKKWLPRIQENQRQIIAESFYDILLEIARQGKTKDIQENVYIKFMCWLYYRFEPILHESGNGDLPKILFEGYLNNYELKMMTILSKIGCDILVLEYEGDENYLKVDPDSSYSQLLRMEGTSFPADYSVLELQKQLANKRTEAERKNFRTEKIINTNTWIKGEPLMDTLTLQSQRGDDPRFFYNLYAGIYGVEDCHSYYSDLLKWKMKAEAFGKKIVLIEEKIPPPSFEEIGAVKRKNYNSANVMMNDLVMQIRCENRKFQTYCQNAFLETFLEMPDISVQELLNAAVVQLCWINRYGNQLIGSPEEGSIFLFYGEAKGKNEECFFRILEKLPIDSLIINPEGSPQQQGIQSNLFFAKKYDNVVKREKFPVDLSCIQFGTVAYQAEQDLNNILYQDTGIYRSQQFKTAIPVSLQITYEEIAILWNQEAKYRPNFEVFDDKVMVPVIFSKVSGIPANIDTYWDTIGELLSEEVIVIQEFPYAKSGNNPFKDKAYTFLQNGRLKKDQIKNYSTYPFSFIREPMQDYMLNKLQEMIDSKIIRGTCTNGMENLITATVLNMDKTLLRLIQKYDFTKQIPKVILVHTKESSGSAEDSILLAYLNLIGFDIVMFVPTGYTTVERFYTRPIFVEHQVGEYKYDLEIPDFDGITKKRFGFASRLFRRGR